MTNIADSAHHSLPIFDKTLCALDGSWILKVSDRRKFVAAVLVRVQNFVACRSYAAN